MKDFIEALNNKKYDLLKKILQKMPYEKQWPAMGVSLRTCHKHNEFRDLSFTYTFSIQWTPLLAAAYASDENAIQLILERWPLLELVTRTQQALNQACQGLEPCTENICGNSNILKTPFLSLPKVKKAQQLVIYFAEKNLENFHFNYSKQDKLMMSYFFVSKIEEITSLDNLINFYADHIDMEAIVVRRNPLNKLTSFFLENADYPNSKITFIEAIQKRALVLMNNDEIYADSIKLLNSQLFAEKHYKCGVNKKFQDVLQNNIMEKNLIALNLAEAQVEEKEDSEGRVHEEVAGEEPRFTNC